MKKLLACALALTLSVSAFSLTSGKSIATAGSIKDNASYFMDPINWNKMDFNKIWAFTSITSASAQEGNLAAAFKLKNKGTLMTSWNGNLWADPDDYNTMSLMYAKDAFSFGASLGVGNLDFYHPVYPAVPWGPEEQTVFEGFFGMNINPQSAFSLGLRYNNFEKDTIDDPFTLVATYQHSFKPNSILSAQYLGFYMNENATANIISTNYQYEYKAKNFTYGLNTNVSFNFMKDMFMLKSSITNGISTNLSKLLTLNAGLSTSLPELYKEKDVDLQTGLFSNTFYYGLSLQAGDNVTIDASSAIDLPNGISFETIWQTSFLLTVALKF